MTDNQPTFAQLAAALTEAHGKTTPNWYPHMEQDGEMMPDGTGGLGDYEDDGHGIDHGGEEGDGRVAEWFQHKDDRDFSILAHNTLPALIAAAQGEMERLRGQLRSARAYLGEAHDALRDADLMLRGQAIQTPETFHRVTVDVPDHIETKMGEIDEALERKG